MTATRGVLGAVDVGHGFVPAGGWNWGADGSGALADLGDFPTLPSGRRGPFLQPKPLLNTHRRARRP
jgi:hypothetical protein